MNIEIPFPCSEDINNMNSVDNDKYCLSCNKIVVDFSQMTNKEIQDYFIEYSNQQTCGIFRSEVIQNKEFAIPLEIVKKNYRKTGNVFILSFLVAFGFLNFGCNETTPNKSIIHTQTLTGAPIPNQKEVYIDASSLRIQQITNKKDSEKLVSPVVTVGALVLPNVIQENDTIENRPNFINDIDSNKSDKLIGDTILRENLKMGKPLLDGK